MVFATCHGTFEFMVMPFRLMNVPASFNWVSMLVYIGNIIVFSWTFEEHLMHLQEVFNQLCATNMFVKPNKCCFCCWELLFLGHIISKDGIAADPAKLKAVVDMEVPANVTEVWALLGLCNYYWRFVPDFASITNPLYWLTLTEGQWWAWKASSKEAFDWLKAAMVTPLVLAFPNYNTPFMLYANASKLAIGAVLSQGQGSEEQVIAYASQWLLGSERNYSVCKWECLSIIYWITFFHHYLHGSKFIIITNHTALKWLMEAREQHGQLAHWAHKLQLYKFKIMHHAGSEVCEC
jgi:hypothetical protein